VEINHPSPIPKKKKERKKKKVEEVGDRRDSREPDIKICGYNKWKTSLLGQAICVYNFPSYSLLS
jgi:hypothetical protein